jgi:UDP-sulfoquinovose synthase
MGEYGTPNIDIEEGFIDIEHKGRKDRFLFPRQASSLYHTSKIHDTDLLYFYVRTWGLKVTDLMQGPVYGLFTKEMNNNEQLRTFFNYDSIFGTVINRFVVQATMGIPLTLYGSGNQNRGYINLLDTMECVALTAENPPSSGELRIFNQFTQKLSVRQIAEKVTRAAKGLGIDVTTTCIENPRTEADEHYYNPVTKGLQELGLVPVLLDEKILVEMLTVVLEHKRHVNTEIIHSKVNWR